MSGAVILAVLVCYPIFGALAAGMIGKRQEAIRDYFADFVVVSEFILAGGLFLGYAEQAESLCCDLPEICGMGLHFTTDGFRLLYGMIAAFMWMMTTILSREYMKNHEERNRYYLFLLATLGAVMGVFLAADLFTMFLFFEIMSFTSYVWVAQEETGEALRAAGTYLAVALIGGLVMLMGIFLLYHEFGTLQISGLLPAARSCENKKLLYGAGVCLVFGFGAKAGAFPLHIWLPKAHPAAPAPASALLSGILTKTGIFGILVVSCNLFLQDGIWGSFLLATGVLTMFLGAFLALFSVDLKRTLACSSMSQIGFILTGVGMQGLAGAENVTAAHGTLLHMVNHSLIKLVLFMAAGVIVMNAHALDLNRIRGFGRKKPLLKGIFLTGALAIGGIPLFGGYISKTLLHESITEYGGSAMMKAVEAVFLLSGGLTAAYMTKLFAAIFIEKNQDAETQAKYDGQKRYMNRESGFALTGSALVLLLWGLFPHTLMDRAAALGESFLHADAAAREAVQTISYFSLQNLKGVLSSLVIGGAVYVIVVRKLLMQKNVYLDVWPRWLDLEQLLYRPLLLGFLPTIGRIVCRICDSVTDFAVVALRKTVYRDLPLPYERKEGNVITELIGRTLALGQWLRNHLWGRKNPRHKDFVHLSAMRTAQIRESFMIIQRSLSFGLLMFGVGLTLTLVYIILW